MLEALRSPRARAHPSSASSSSGSGGSWVTHPRSPASWEKLDDDPCANAEPGIRRHAATIVVTTHRTKRTLSPIAGAVQVAS